MNTKYRRIARRQSPGTLALVCLCSALVLAITLYFFGAIFAADKQSIYYTKMEDVFGGLVKWLFSSSGFSGVGLLLVGAIINGKQTTDANKKIVKIARTLFSISIAVLIVSGFAWCAAFAGELKPPQSTAQSQGSGTDDNASPVPAMLIDPHPWGFVKPTEDLDEQATGVINWLISNRFPETSAKELTEDDYGWRVATAANDEAKAKSKYPITIKRYLSPEEKTIQTAYLNALLQEDGPIELRIEADDYGKTFANRWQTVIYYENAGDICLRLSDYPQAFGFFQDEYYWCIEALLVADTETEARTVLDTLQRLYGINNDRLGDADLVQVLPGSISENQLSQSVTLWEKISERMAEFLPSGN